MDQDALGELRASIARFLDRHSPIEAARAVAEGGTFDGTTWQRLCAEFDVLALAIPEEVGGLGGGVAAVGVCAEEFGRVLYPGPWLASGILAARTLATLAPPDLREQYLPAILAGTSIATLALHASTTPVLDPILADTSTTAKENATGWSVTGSKHLVPDLGFADVVIVSAVDAEDGTAGLYLVPLDDTSGQRSEYTGADLTRRFGFLELTNSPATLIASGDAAQDGIRHHLDLARLLQAAESVGAATATLTSGLEYARIREQYGRPIGSFQSVKHKYADLFRDVESARHITGAALAEADAGAGDIRLPASIAATRSSDAFYATAKEVIHLHGGIGYTWEHNAHLYYRRALHSRAALGDPARHRERIAALIGL